MSTGLAGLLANVRRPELFKKFAPHFVTHPSPLFTDTVEPSVAGLLANVRRPELFKKFAPHFVTHPSLLFTDTVEPSVAKPVLTFVYTYYS